MSTVLPIGRWLGLKKTSNEQDIFTILAFDQRGTFRKMMPAGTSYEAAVEMKQEVVTTLSQHASAVLLDAEYGLSSALHMSRHSGLLLALEKSGYSGDSTYRKVDFDMGWDVAKIKQVGASAVKLLAYYHPDSGALAEEIEALIRKIAAECHAQDIPLFVEPLSYSLNAGIAKESAEFAATRAKAVIETARRLSTTGLDVLKLEFPEDADFEKDQDVWRSACEAVSEASTVPWVLLSAGVDFGTFADQTRIACEAGASGFLAGRAIWKESISLLDPLDRERFLTNTAIPRLQKLSDIAVKYARPWTQFYTSMAAENGWYQHYPA